MPIWKVRIPVYILSGLCAPISILFCIQINLSNESLEHSHRLLCSKSPLWFSVGEVYRKLVTFKMPGAD